MECHQEGWLRRAKGFSNNEFANKQIKSELYDFSWWATKDTILCNTKLSNNMKLFEVGVGWGRIIHMLKTEFPQLKVEGIELTKELYERALDLVDRYSFQDVSLFLGDILTFPSEQYKAQYDTVISVRVLHYISDKRKTFQILYNLLKEGGIIFVSIPNKFCPLRWFTYHNPLYSIFKLKVDLESAGFKKAKIGFYNFRFPFIRNKGSNKICRAIERFLRNSPLLRFIGGLSFVVAEK